MVLYTSKSLSIIIGLLQEEDRLIRKELSILKEKLTQPSISPVRLTVYLFIYLFIYTASTTQ